MTLKEAINIVETKLGYTLIKTVHPNMSLILSKRVSARTVDDEPYYQEHVTVIKVTQEELEQFDAWKEAEAHDS